MIIHLTEEKFRQLITEKVYCILIEYYESRKEFKNSIGGTLYQVIENYCIILFEYENNRNTEKIEYWKNEFNKQVNNILRTKITSNNSFNSRMNAIKEVYDDVFRNLNSIINDMSSKFIKEKFSNNKKDSSNKANYCLTKCLNNHINDILELLSKDINNLSQEDLSQCDEKNMRFGYNFLTKIFG